MTTLHCDIDISLGDFRLALNMHVGIAGITAIFGASGAGKTTLLRILAGLEPQARGRLALGDDVWQDERRFVAPERRRIGYVFQDGALFDHLSVESNLRFPLRFRRGTGGLSFGDAVDALELSGLLTRRPATLSGGERQRVAVARALLGARRLLLMDEPVSALDVGRRRKIVDMIAGLPERFGIPVVYVTHDAGELLRLADRVLLLESGSAVVADDVRRVARQAAFGAGRPGRHAGAVLSAVVLAHAGQVTTLDVDGRTLKVPTLDAAPQTRILVRVPARDVVIALSKPTGLSIRNALDAVVASVTAPEAGVCDVELRLTDQSVLARVTSDAVQELGLREGLAVFALVKSVAVEDALGDSRD